MKNRIIGIKLFFLFFSLVFNLNTSVGSQKNTVYLCNSCNAERCPNPICIKEHQLLYNKKYNKIFFFGYLAFMEERNQTKSIFN